jgi:hypothetical protein
MLEPEPQQHHQQLHHAVQTAPPRSFGQMMEALFRAWPDEPVREFGGIAPVEHE